MYIFLLVVYAILCLALIGLILLQRGRGSSTGLTYDPQSSVFGSSGSVSFLVKFTAVLAVLFFVLGIVIGINFRDSLQTEEKSLIERTIEDEGQGEQTEGAGEGDALNDIPSAGDIPSVGVGEDGPELINGGYDAQGNFIEDGVPVAPDAGAEPNADVPADVPAIEENDKPAP